MKTNTAGATPQPEARPCGHSAIRTPKSALSKAIPHSALRTPHLSGMALIVLTDIYEKRSHLPLEELAAELDGLSELIGHHPALQEETAAMRAVVHGFNRLNDMCWQAHDLANTTPQPQPQLS